MLKGIYLLYIKLNKKQMINIGKLGSIIFEKGFYIYIGSAKNGIYRRVYRHLSSKKRFHWHIDYFLDNDYATIQSVFYNDNGNYSECDIAAIFLEKFSNYSYPVKKFGCSDCKCESHFYYFPKSIDIKDFPVRFKTLL